MSLTDIQRERRSESQRKYYHNPANRHKDLARGAVLEALQSGRLVRGTTCEKCGDGADEAHHPDYSKPLEVEWLCVPCHREIHRKTHCKHGHGYTPENTYVRSNGKRHCRACRTEDMRRHNAVKIAPEIVGG